MSESARDKLRRLRGDDAPAPVEALAPTVAPAPLSARARLVRRAAAHADEEASARFEPAARVAPVTPERPGARRLGLPERLATEDADGTALLARRTLCPSGAPHGAFALSEVRHVDARAFALLAGDAALAGLDLERAVFLDTETSGLAGGSGTWVFLVGLGRFVPAADGAAFEVWQGFLAQPADERALLHETAERVRAADGIVSFFGKSFDRHRLEDRMRMHGVEPPFAGRAHLDLYFPLRRLYGRALDDVRLRTVERALLELEREDDLPGAFAPEAWFDFLAGRPHRLEGVFEHNRHDVLSLAALAAHLGRTLCESRACGAPLPGPAAARAHALARAWFEAGERGEALGWVERARERAPSRALDLLEADALRLSGAWERAWSAYDALARAAEDAHAARAWAELAKLAEHKRKDVALALECCERAKALRGHLSPALRASSARELAARAARLEAKRAGAAAAKNP